MSVDGIGFDGKVRRPAPSLGRWMASCFALTLLYWMAARYALGSEAVFILMTPPEPVSPPLLVLLLKSLPVLFVLGMALFFGLRADSVLGWLKLMTGCAIASALGFWAFFFTVFARDLG